MYKMFLLMLTIGGFVFADSLNNTSSCDIKSDYQQYNLMENTSSDDDKVEAGRRRGKGNRGRRKGGGGLR